MLPSLWSSSSTLFSLFSCLTSLPQWRGQQRQIERSQLANVGRILLISAQTFFFCLDKSCTTWKKNYIKKKGSCFALKWNFKVKRSPLRRGKQRMNIALPLDDLKFQNTILDYRQSKFACVFAKWRKSFVRLYIHWTYVVVYDTPQRAVT